MSTPNKLHYIISNIIGTDYYPTDKDYRTITCKVINSTIITNAIKYSNIILDSSGKITPKEMESVLEVVKYFYNSEKTFIIEESIHNFFKEATHNYINAFSVLGNVWLPDTWKEVKSV